MREKSIDENYERNVTPVRSEISRFSRGIGVWEATLDPLDPGAYPYSFSVDGTSVIDPSNVDVERMQVTVRSILYVPGGRFHGYQGRPSRRGCGGELLLEGAREVPAHACLHSTRL